VRQPLDHIETVTKWAGRRCLSVTSPKAAIRSGAILPPSPPAEKATARKRGKTKIALNYH